MTDAQQLFLMLVVSVLAMLALADVKRTEDFATVEAERILNVREGRTHRETTAADRERVREFIRREIEGQN